jgi:hypothetical protein
MGDETERYEVVVSSVLFPFLIDLQTDACNDIKISDTHIFNLCQFDHILLL